MCKIHTLTNEDGDNLSFMDYGEHGVNVQIKVYGEWLDFDFGPHEIPALIEWLTNAQQKRS